MELMKPNFEIAGEVAGGDLAKYLMLLITDVLMTTVFTGIGLFNGIQQK